MLRNRHCTLPSGRITERTGLVFGMTLVTISLVLSAIFNILSLVWMGLGVVDNVVVYSMLLKRRTWLNILLGGFSGGLPVMFGWSVVTPGQVGGFSWLAVVSAGVVFLVVL